MRKAYHDSAVLFKEDKLQIICLGYDFTAEHEFGIKEIRANFGVNINDEPKGLLKYLKSYFLKEKSGIEKFVITEIPNSLMSSQKIITVDKKRYKVYFLGTGQNWRTTLENSDFFMSKIKSEMNFSKELNGWWDEKSFLIASTNQAIINQLFAAFSKKDVAIWLSGSANPFAGSGLVFAIKSNIDQDLLDNLFLNN